jgi:putative oxidoreductase
MTGSPASSDAALSYGVLLARVLLSAVFLYSGQDKLRHWQAGIDEIADLGLPWPQLLAAGTIATQLVGGLAVLTGVGAVWGAAILALFTVAATVAGHRFWRLHGDRAKQEFTTSMEHLAIVGGLLLLIVTNLQGR